MGGPKTRKKIQDSGQPPSWKIEKQSYLGNGLTNRHHSWYADALWPYEPYRQLKIWNSKIQNGGRRDGRYVNKKLSYRWETARRAILENSCYASRSMEIRKFSNSKSDIHCHSRALEMVPFNRPHAISIILPLQLCLLKRSRDPEHILFGVINHACNSTPLINQHTTFEVPSFTDSKDDWGKVKFKKNGSRDPDSALLGVVCHPYPMIWYLLPVCKIWLFYIQPFQRYGWSPRKLSGSRPDHAPFGNDLSSVSKHLLLSTYLPHLKYLSPPTTKRWKAIQNIDNWVGRFSTAN